MSDILPSMCCYPRPSIQILDLTAIVGDFYLKRTAEASRFRGVFSLSQSCHDSVQETVKKQFELESQERDLFWRSLGFRLQIPHLVQSVDYAEEVQSSWLQASEFR
jgi:hypothetical protein